MHWTRPLPSGACKYRFWIQKARKYGLDADRDLPLKFPDKEGAQTSRTSTFPIKAVNCDIAGTGA